MTAHTPLPCAIQEDIISYPLAVVCVINNRKRGMVSEAQYNIRNSLKRATCCFRPYSCKYPPILSQNPQSMFGKT